MQVLGIDIGGSGIKGAIVDTDLGELVSERHRIETPQPATPEAVAQTVKELVEHFNWRGSIGFGFPAAIVNGECKTASNIDKSFIGVDLAKLFTQTTGCPCYVINDADAAGMAEIAFGLGKDQKGLIAFVTLGTGIGTALFIDGQLVPNCELGHIRIEEGGIGEHYAADSVRKREDLSWSKWGNRLNSYLNQLYFLCYPAQMILGGGASKKLEKFEEYLDLPCHVHAAQLLNEAGIIGAAAYARKQSA